MKNPSFKGFYVGVCVMTSKSEFLIFEELNFNSLNKFARCSELHPVKGILATCLLKLYQVKGLAQLVSQSTVKHLELKTFIL